MKKKHRKDQNHGKNGFVTGNARYSDKRDKARQKMGRSQNSKG